MKTLLSAAVFWLVPIIHNMSAVPVTFSGGGTSTLTMTLTQPVTYAVTQTDGSAPIFDFEGIDPVLASSGGPFPTPLTPDPVSSDIFFSKNGGSPVNVTEFFQNFSGSTLIFSSLLPGVAAGDVIVLSAGSLTVNYPFGDLFGSPSDGDFTTYIVSGITGDRISDFGVTTSVPDSISMLWLALPVGGLLGFARRVKTS